MTSCTRPLQTHEQKIQSLQYSIVFLQNEHASTLSSLHKEIEILQKRCSGLTHQLTFISTFDNGNETGPAIKSALEDEIRVLHCQHKELVEGIKTKDKQINLLEGQLCIKQQNYNEDFKIAHNRISELENKLECKCKIIAQLTTQIQQPNKINYESKQIDDIAIMDISDDRNKGVDVKNNILKLQPTPPTYESPLRRRSYNLRQSVSTAASASTAGVIQECDSHQILASEQVLQNSSILKTNVKRLSSRTKQTSNNLARCSAGPSQIRRDCDLKVAVNSKPKPSDYEDFIKISQSQSLIPKPNVEPLPPITTRSGRQLRDPPIKTRERLLRSNRATANARGEIETVILDTNLPSPERTLRRIKNSSK